MAQVRVDSRWVMVALCCACHAALAFGRVASAQGAPVAPAAQTAPVIEHIEPTSGPPGTVVQIVGRRFGAAPSVSLGAAAVTVLVSQPNRIKFSIGANTASGNITVATSTGSVRGPEFRVTPPPPAPTIEALDPERGPPGTELQIRGKNFSPKLMGNVVTLGGKPVVVQAAAVDMLRVTIPAAPSGPIVVRVDRSGEATSAKKFEVTEATAVTDVQPPRGGPGSEIVIRGHGFSTVVASNRVYLNNVRLTVKTASPTELVVQLSTKVASGKLLVDVLGAGRASSAAAFVVQRPPSIAEFSPKKGVFGTVVTVRGTNFGTNVDVIDAKIGDAKLLVRAASDTRLTLEITPAAKPGKLSIRVHGVGPAWSAENFVALPMLRITSFAPRSGPAGTEVVIAGEGFGDSPAHNRVTIGGQSASVLEAAPNRLKIRVPKAKSGPIEISVPGTSSARTAMPFVITVPPEVTDASPRKGPVGTELTIRGRGFGTSVAALLVTLGGQPLDVQSVRDDVVVARIAPGAKSGRLAVTVPLQGSSKLAWEFQVAEAKASSAEPKR